MDVKEKIGSYLARLALSHQEVGRDTWVISDREKGLDGVFVSIADSLVIIRTNVADVPRDRREALFERLLRLNASDMVHGAYCIDGNKIVIVDTLEGDPMDIEEFEASLDAIGMATAQHYKVLAPFLTKP